MSSSRNSLECERYANGSLYQRLTIASLFKRTERLGYSIGVVATDGSRRKADTFRISRSRSRLCFPSSSFALVCAHAQVLAVSIPNAMVRSSSNTLRRSSRVHKGHCRRDAALSYRSGRRFRARTSQYSVPSSAIVLRGLPACGDRIAPESSKYNKSHLIMRARSRSPRRFSVALAPSTSRRAYPRSPRSAYS